MEQVLIIKIRPRTIIKATVVAYATYNVLWRIGDYLEVKLEDIKKQLKSEGVIPE